MSYQRIRTPRIYTDNISWLLGLGKITSNSITQSGLTTASPIEMFDMKPSNLVDLGGSGTSTTHYIKLNTNITTDSAQDANFIAILGHNFEEAGVKFKVEISDNSNFPVGTETTILSLTNVVNASLSGDYAVPSANGWSLATFSGTTDNQWVRITFEPTTGTPIEYQDDVKIGAILIGEYLNFPHSPDLEINKQLIFDGVKKQQSIGGQTYANASFLSGANWYHEPYVNSGNVNPNPLRRTGRLSVDMNFSYLTDTDVFPQEFNDNSHLIGADNLMGNLIQRTAGGMYPFLICFDPTGNIDDDSYLWCRLNNTPKFKQVANQVWNCDISLLEEF